MNTRVRQIALRILLIKEEFSNKDISEAVKFLSSGEDKELLTHLSKESGARKIYEGRVKKSPESQKSSAILKLELTDPEKYQILSEFDYLIRKGEILPKISDIRMLGIELSKTFDAGRSRKEAIPKLMEQLAMMPLDQVREIAQSVLEEAPSLLEANEDYQRLAKFLISGKASC